VLLEAYRLKSNWKIKNKGKDKTGSKTAWYAIGVLGMKAKIRIPFFEIGTKNYIYGDEVLGLAKAAEAASKKYDIDILFITPYTEIRRVVENTERLVVLAPYMDILRPGRGMADVLPEAIKAAGAKGVVMNHCERPMTLSAVKKTIDRANELDLLSFACADTIAEAQAIAQLHPDIINPEPTELIGSGKTSDMGYVKKTIEVIKAIYPDIMVEQAAGITSGRQVYDFIIAGSDAAGAGSGIINAPDPYAMIDEMVGSVRKAYGDLQKTRRSA
jgi:triosephosphate isomerase